MRGVLSRVVYHLSLLVGIILFSFVMFHAVPSDPARVILGPNASEEQVRALSVELGLHEPLAVQFFTYLKRSAQFDFGSSYVDRRGVTNEVAGKLKVTLGLLAVSLGLIVLYVAASVAVAFWLSPKPADALDFLLASSPTFFSGIVTALLVSRLYPFTSFSGSLDRAEDVLALVPPALVLAFYPMASLSRIVRGAVDSVKNAAYIRTARAFGLPERTILSRYVLKNAMIPFLATLSNQIPILFTGTFIVEVIFSLPGIGSLLVKSLLQRDFPMLEGIVILSGAVVIMVHLLSEVLCRLVDPRVREADVLQS